MGLDLCLDLRYSPVRIYSVNSNLSCYFVRVFMESDDSNFNVFYLKGKYKQTHELIEGWKIGIIYAYQIH